VKQITYTKSALKTLRRIPANDTRRIRSEMEQFAASPESLANNVKALAGLPYIRLRVGDWRLIMDDNDIVLEVLMVGAQDHPRLPKIAEPTLTLVAPKRIASS
jgi:mRNA interferase RelE/StbE